MGRGNHGFTLLELLISITLLAVITTLLAYAIHIGSSAWGRSNQTIASSQDQHLIEEFITREISQARALRIRTSKGSRVAFEGYRNAVRFAAILPIHRGVGGIYFVSVAAEGADDSQQLALSYRLARPLDFVEGDPESEERTVLVDKLTDAQFQYYGSVTNEEPPSWMTEWPNEQQLPEMVRVRFATKAKQSDLFIPLYTSRRPTNTNRRRR